MTYFNRKLMKRDIPASATVEGALVIPVILYAVAAVMFLLQLISHSEIIMSHTYHFNFHCPHSSVILMFTPF